MIFSHQSIRRQIAIAFALYKQISPNWPYHRPHFLRKLLFFNLQKWVVSHQQALRHGKACQKPTRLRSSQNEHEKKRIFRRSLPIDGQPKLFIQMALIQSVMALKDSMWPLSIDRHRSRLHFVSQIVARVSLATDWKLTRIQKNSNLQFSNLTKNF